MKKHRILIVDDEPINIVLLQDVLKDEDHEVLSVCTGEEALDVVKNFKPDLILLDIMMPGIDGYEVCKKIRQNESLTLTKIIMVSALAKLEERLAAYDVGADDYVIRPFRKEELLAKIRLVMRLKDSESKLETYRRNLEAIFRSVKDGIVTVDHNMNIIEANGEIRQICCISGEIIGKPFQEVFKNCNSVCQNILNETLVAQNIIREYRVECKHDNKPSQVVLLSSSPLIDQNEDVKGAVLVVRDATKINDLEKELIGQYKFHNIIGKSQIMQNIYSLLENLADTNTTVMITGESGTGKEMAASALHYSSSRANKPLIKVNCSALAETLLESELFGHVKGAFTGAIKNRIGRFQAAHEGTIFLDEIGDISPLIQLKLLRVLQEKEYERVGDSTTYKVDVRVIAATNQNLKEKVRRGEFREDLYYRLKVVEINLPSLRDRKEDIPLLFDHFRKQFSKAFNKNIDGMSEGVLKVFMEYPWPGNIRELQHAIEHCFVLCTGRTITLDNMPSELREFTKYRHYSPKKKAQSEEEEVQLITDALKKTGWNKAKASRLLGMSRPTLYKRVEEYKIIEPAGK